MRSVMKNQFATVPQANIPRSSFNLSHGHKTVLDCDYLIPIAIMEVIPGDTHNVTAHALLRLNSPTLHPLMDNLQATIHWFFAPARILWDNWEKMHGAQDNPADTISYTVPAVSNATSESLNTLATSWAQLCNYMGLPHASQVDMTEISALPFRCYNKIWADWYRDENLQDSPNISTDNGPDAGATDYGLLKRGKRYDYFTASLPSPQKGSAVSVALQGDVYTDAAAAGNLGIWSTGQADHVVMTASTTYLQRSTTTTAAEGNKMYVDINPTVNEFRLAFQTQRLLERDARSGTRYVEHLAAHFGINNYPDARLQRPEFLGGGRIPIQINAVPNTSEDATQKQGELTGYGVGSGEAGFTKSFVEWGYIMGLLSVQGDVTYSQGLDRMWTRSTRYDFAYPVLSQVGEEAVLDKEIYYFTADGQNDDVWGYQPRYESYRFKNSRNTHLMNPDATGTLASWHLQEQFTSRPALDDTFIQSNTATPLDRAIALPSEPQFNADIYFDWTAARPLPVYGIPGNLDHL